MNSDSGYERKFRMSTLNHAKLCIALLCIAALPCRAQRPNVIFFVMDDLNDWVTPLGY